MDELDADARAFLDDYRDEVTPSAEADRVAWSGVRARIAATPAIDRARRRRRVAMLAIAGLGLAAAAVLMFGRGSTQRLAEADERAPAAPYVAPTESPQPATTRTAVVADPPRPIPPPTVSEPPIRESPPRDRPRVRATPAPLPPPPQEAPTAESLALELAILEPADAAIRSGRAARALELYDRHAKEFPRSALAEERDAGRVLALCALGDAKAVEQRDAFAKRWRGSPLLGRIDRACD